MIQLSLQIVLSHRIDFHYFQADVERDDSGNLRGNNAELIQGHLSRARKIVLVNLETR